MSCRVRFAPSPTGYLHIGNVRTALFNYLYAKNQHGELVLRVEDTDKERSKPEFTQQIFKDLKWLGIIHDEGPDKEGSFAPYEQSKRLELYQEAVKKLMSEGKAYRCFCTPEVLEQIKKQSQSEGKPPRYDNRCRNLTEKQVQEKLKEGQKPAIRFKIDDPELEFEDLIRGSVRFDLSLFSDFIIVRPEGMPTFHLAVCYDDGSMGITHVIRGEDHISNTPRHILLIQALGFKVPQYAHLSLIMGKEGGPLSKRTGAKSIEEYSRLGYLPEALANYLALLGWSSGDDREIFSMEQLTKEFSLKRITKSAAIFDPEKLNWINGEHLRALTDEVYTGKAMEYLKAEHGIPESLSVLPEEELKQIILVFKDNILRFEELKDRLLIFDSQAAPQDENILKQNGVGDILTILGQYLESLTDEEALDFSALNQKLKAGVSVKGKELYMPLRVALTFRSHGPEMKRIMPYLKKALCLKRLKQAIDITKS